MTPVVVYYMQKATTTPEQVSDVLSRSKAPRLLTSYLHHIIGSLVFRHTRIFFIACLDEATLCSRKVPSSKQCHALGTGDEAGAEQAA